MTGATSALRSASGVDKSVAEKKTNPLVTVQQFLEGKKGQLTAALPSHITPDRMTRLALTSLSQSASLLRAASNDPKSLYSAIIMAAQLGLEIGVGGQGWLVPYGRGDKAKVQFVPGWQGIADLVARAGRSTVWTGAVYEGDEFDWSLGDRPFVTHKPCGESDDKKITHFYAIGRVKGAEFPVIEVWTDSRVRAHRNKFNKVGGDHYSYENWEMYGRKVVLLQVMKYMPKSVEIQAATEVMNNADTGKGSVLKGDFVVVAGYSFDEVAEAIEAADSNEALDAAADMMSGIDDNEQINDLRIRIDAKRASLAQAQQ